MGVLTSPRSSFSKPRKPSLKEQPSYLKEVSIALTRREELFKFHQALATSQEYQLQLININIFYTRKMSGESKTSQGSGGEDF